ncbi:hypothetical protein BLNAU_4632 [Blattamonas nauphoetae]|uniref:CCHC-type domain-containing protein n=1 Tax=Blattamonas nauphoetae TaxID=2049346 RepID=A0ABQ9Y9J0_9EUKA|nr:hypothetical protein BLNAU_4632 [Blattamonas nauphoetae]
MSESEDSEDIIFLDLQFPLPPSPRSKSNYEVHTRISSSQEITYPHSSNQTAFISSGPLPQEQISTEGRTFNQVYSSHNPSALPTKPTVVDATMSTSQHSSLESTHSLNTLTALPQLQETSSVSQNTPNSGNTLSQGTYSPTLDSLILTRMKAFAESFKIHTLYFRSLFHLKGRTPSEFAQDATLSEWIEFVSNDPVLVRLYSTLHNTTLQKHPYITHFLAPANPQPSIKKRSKQTLRCFRCGLTGHHIDTCPRQVDDRETATFVVKSCCYKCGESGHHSKECRNTDKRICYHCQKTGHIMKYCPFKLLIQQKPQHGQQKGQEDPFTPNQ